MISFGDTIFLIDFIPSTVDSFLSDFAKIEQDLLYGWSYRFCNRFIQSDAKVFCMHAYPSLGYKLAVDFKTAYWILSLINWFRIIPYIEDEQTDDLVAITIRNCYPYDNRYLGAFVLTWVFIQIGNETDSSLGGNSTRYELERPKWLLTLPSGRLMVEDAVSGVDTANIESVVIVVIKENLKNI